MGQPSRNILVVDDDPSILRWYDALLSRQYDVELASSGEDALDSIMRRSPDLVLLDIDLPGMDGYATCRQLKAAATETLPQVIMVSGRSAADEQAAAFQALADDFIVKPVAPAELRSRIELHFRLRDNQKATAALQQEVDSHHSALKQAARETMEQTLAIQDVAVFTLAKVCELRDNETGHHIVRMREYSQRVALELQRTSPYAKQITETFLADLYRSSPLHDIGKVGIPDAILLKPGRLTAAEFSEMKRHTEIGGKILEEAATQLRGAGFLSMAAEIATFHHERWDGDGYLAGLSGRQIPLAARIVSVADVYDALTSQRPYKSAWTPDHAKQTIDEAAGSQFDPTIVAAFDRCFDDILRIQQDHADDSQITAAPVEPVKDQELAVV